MIPVSDVALAASLLPASAPTAGGRGADPVLPGGGSVLQRELDDDVSRVSGHHDAGLGQSLPLARDAVDILVRAHCPSGRVTLLDGDRTPSGAFLWALERAANAALAEAAEAGDAAVGVARTISFIYENTAFSCEKTEGHCVDPRGHK